MCQVGSGRSACSHRRVRLERWHGSLTVVIERDEEGMYVASVPQLQGCHTDASSLDELMVEIREAIELCLEVEGREPSNLEFIGIERATIRDMSTTPAPSSARPRRASPDG